MKDLISKVYRENNLLIMPKFKDNFFFLAPVDPEYGIGESSKNHKSRNTAIRQKNGTKLKAKDNLYVKENWDSKPPPDEYFNQLFRISQNQIIWGANYFKQIVGTPFKPPRRSEFEDFIKKHPKGWILWDKVNSTNDFSDCELAWTSFDRPSVIVRFMWNGMMQGKSIQEGTIQQGNKKLNEKRIHPTQKPMAINRWILSSYIENPHNNLYVFDGGVGSGGMRIACYDLGVNFIGCELSKVSYMKQHKRFKNHISQYSISFL